MSEASLPVTPVTKKVEQFSLGSHWIAESSSLRLDASYYNPAVAAALAKLQASGLPIKTLGEVTESIFIPNRCRRIYVDKEHGIPFLQGSHIVHFQPADLKFVSRAAQKNMEQLIIRAGWVLVTRSGTIGRVTIAPDGWDNWAASEHILRIIPKENVCPSGYLYAYLSSPLGQAQLTAQIYGAVVDELTEEQTRSVQIPIPQKPAHRAIVDAINSTALEAIAKKEEAGALAFAATARVDDLFRRPRPK